MITYIFRPMDKWPRELTRQRKARAPFHSVKRASSGQRYRMDLPFERIVRDLAHAPFISLDWIKSDVAAFRTAHRAARIATHPDASGGDNEASKRVEEAARILAAHHGVES